MAADAVAAAVVATVAPLCFLQAPNAIAWAMACVGTAPDGTQGPVAVLRADGLALPAMAAVGGIAALAVAGEGLAAAYVVGPSRLARCWPGSACRWPPA